MICDENGLGETVVSNSIKIDNDVPGMSFKMAALATMANSFMVGW